MSAPNTFHVVKLQRLIALSSILLGEYRVPCGAFFFNINAINSALWLHHRWVHWLLLLVSFVIKHSYRNSAPDIGYSHAFFSGVRCFSVRNFLFNKVVQKIEIKVEALHHDFILGNRDILVNFLVILNLLRHLLEIQVLKASLLNTEVPALSVICHYILYFLMWGETNGQV